MGPPDRQISLLRTIGCAGGIGACRVSIVHHRRRDQHDRDVIVQIGGADRARIGRAGIHLQAGWSPSGALRAVVQPVRGNGVRHNGQRTVEGRSAFLIPGFWMHFFTAGVFLVFLRVSSLVGHTDHPILVLFCFCDVCQWLAHSGAVARTLDIMLILHHWWLVH